MHELGVLHQVMKMVDGIAQKHHIQQVKHITLEVGESSGYVPDFFVKLFPVAAESFPIFSDASLRIVITPGKQFLVKDIGY